MEQNQEQHRSPRWRASSLLTLVAVAYVAVITAIITYGYLTAAAWVGVSDKTWWDWLVLLLPAAAAAIGAVYTAQRESQEKWNLGITYQRAQDEALQAYLDQMTQLLLERDLRNSANDSEVRTLARAQTLTILDRLDLGQADAHRKKRIIQFLCEAGLVQGSQPVLSLYTANLSYADLHELDLRGINLRGVDLTGARGMTNKQLEQQVFSVKGATMPDGSKHD